jgi:membrane-associated phospholipid phosphatase
MGKKLLLLHLVLGAMIAALGIVFFDRAVAELVRHSGIEGAWLFGRGTAWLDLATGREASKFLLGGTVLLVGVVLRMRTETARAGRAWLYVGIVQLFATLATGMLKNAFGRLRPYEALAAGHWDATWFAGGSAFPSGHTGFYFGLVLPLVALWPRRAWPLLAVPWFIAVARVVGNEHYVGDVGASIAIAAVLALVLRRVAGPDADPKP